MRAEREALFSRRWPYGIGMGLFGFCAGLALMAFLMPRPDRGGAAADDDGMTGSAASSLAAHEAGDAAAKSRTRGAGKGKQRQAAGRLSFTPAQWSQVMRNPRHYYISLQQCFPVGEGDMRGFLSDPHPSFAPQAQLFGWSEDLRLKVHDEVLDYAREMAATEKMGARVEYPERGLIRIDFSTVHAEREAVAAKLRKQLEVTVGRRDAERFLALASLEGVSDGLKDELTIRAEYLKSGAVQLIGVDGMGTTLSGQMAKAAFTKNFDFFKGSYDRRMEHLGLTIDWTRLNPNPDAGIEAEPEPEAESR